MTILAQDFFGRDAVTVAEALIGKVLCRRNPDGTVTRVRISETEAYLGESDSACHARSGRTPRTEVMYGNCGVFYVYLCFGIHHLLNVVTGAVDDPQTVLIRGTLEVPGPGRLTKQLSIDKALNGQPVAVASGLWVEADDFDGRASAHPRIGIDFADEVDLNRPWRFVLQTMIDDEWFDVHIDGLTLVDNYMVPDAEVVAYRTARERFAELIVAEFAKTCAGVSRDYAGSQDGEAVLGLDETGTLVRFIHLDPDTIREMTAAEAAGTIAEYLAAF